ncbi:EamA family transporter, partial [Bacillus sp. B-TM1]
MPYFYVFLLLLTSLLWGGNFVVGKSLVDHASPMTLTSLRWMIAIVIAFNVEISPTFVADVFS